MIKCMVAVVVAVFGSDRAFVSSSLTGHYVLEI